ncbi:MAG: hypothetical protein JW852_08650 [Spirochaetales bacterium]|nr:hypothetical protein [Spirochaetales bacterium]
MEVSDPPPFKRVTAVADTVKSILAFNSNEKYGDHFESPSTKCTSR